MWTRLVAITQYVRAYVTTLPEGSKVSLSQLKGKLKPNQLTSMRFTWSWFVVCGETTNQDHVKRIEVIFAWCKEKRNPGVLQVLQDGGFDVPESTHLQWIVRR